jgi:hypothetical protein
VPFHLCEAQFKQGPNQSRGVSWAQLKMLDTMVKPPSPQIRPVVFPDGGRDRDRTCDPYLSTKCPHGNLLELQAPVPALWAVFGTMFSGRSGFKVQRTREHYL